jgi:hypothetical protein
VGYAVGGAFSVLVAEQLFASGCQLLVNVASAGQIRDVGLPPYYILIDRALRDEGTSYHYLPPAAFANADQLPQWENGTSRRPKTHRPTRPQKAAEFCNRIRSLPGDKRTTYAQCADSDEVARV